MPPLPPRKTDTPLPPKWSGGKLTCRVVRGGRDTGVETPCSLLGPLAVHRSHHAGTAAWSVSHAPTGLWVADCKTEADARRVAEALLCRCGSALGKDAPEEVTSSLPAWVFPWVRKIRSSRRYEEPPTRKDNEK